MEYFELQVLGKKDRNALVNEWYDRHVVRAVRNGSLQEGVTNLLMTSSLVSEIHSLYPKELAKRLWRGIPSHRSSVVPLDGGQIEHGKIQLRADVQFWSHHTRHFLDALSNTKFVRQMTKTVLLQTGLSSIRAINEAFDKFLREQRERGLREPGGVTVLWQSLDRRQEIVRLDDSQAYRNEGWRMSHCVGGYRFRKDAIFSLRNVDDAERSIATMEVESDGTVSQVKARFNKTPSVEDRSLLSSIGAVKKSEPVCPKGRGWIMNEVYTGRLVVGTMPMWNDMYGGVPVHGGNVAVAGTDRVYDSEHFQEVIRGRMSGFTISLDSYRYQPDYPDDLTLHIRYPSLRYETSVIKGRTVLNMVARDLIEHRQREVLWVFKERRRAYPRWPTHTDDECVTNDLVIIYVQPTLIVRPKKDTKEIGHLPVPNPKPGKGARIERLRESRSRNGRKVW